MCLRSLKPRGQVKTYQCFSGIFLHRSCLLHLSDPSDLTEENNYFTSRAKISIITNVPVCVTWIMECRMKWHDVQPSAQTSIPGLYPPCFRALSFRRPDVTAFWASPFPNPDFLRWERGTGYLPPCEGICGAGAPVDAGL